MRDTEGFLYISGIIMKYLRTQLRAMQDSKQQIQIVKLLPDVDALVDVLNSTVSSTALSYLSQATIHPVQVTIRLQYAIETSLPIITFSFKHMFKRNMSVNYSKNSVALPPRKVAESVSRSENHA